MNSWLRWLAADEWRAVWRWCCCGWSFVSLSLYKQCEHSWATFHDKWTALIIFQSSMFVIIEIWWMRTKPQTTRELNKVLSGFFYSVGTTGGSNTSASWHEWRHLQKRFWQSKPWMVNATIYTTEKKNYYRLSAGLQEPVAHTEESQSSQEPLSTWFLHEENVSAAESSAV